MPSIEYNDFSMDSLIELLKVFDITYDDTCEESSGWNLSDIDDIPISILNLKEQRSVTNLDREGSNFMWKTLLVDCLTNMQYKSYDNRNELVQVLKHKHKDEPDQLEMINQFQMDYNEENPLIWYKKESCIVYDLNKALRFSCMNVILPYRFFIRDLASQLAKEQPNFPNPNSENIIKLYRGQRMKTNEIDDLKHLTPGCLISVDSYFSSSRSIDIAKNFMRQIKTEEDEKKQPVYYEIKCDLNLQTKPYADISSRKFGSNPEEKEVLFMVGTIFKFKKMFYDETSRCWIIKLQLFDENKYRSSKLYKSLRKEMGEVTDLLTLGALLFTAGEFEHALRIYLRSFFDTILFDDYSTEDGANILTLSLMGFAGVQGELGKYDYSIDIFNRTIEFINTHKNLHERKYHKAMAYYSKSLPLSEKGQYFDALKQCKKALNIFTEYLGYYDLNVANSYEMMGNIYGNLGRLEKTKGNINKHYQYFQMAYHYYNKALDIRKKVHEDVPDHYETNATYLNIGELYRDIGQSDKALEYTNRGYDSFVKAFPKSHYWIAVALDNIGEIYVQQQRFDEAKKKYDEAIEIYGKTLPSDHRFIGETLHNIGKLYCCIHMFDEALHYFNQAKKIYKKKIPSYHYLASELLQQINYVKSQLH